MGRVSVVAQTKGRKVALSWLSSTWLTEIFDGGRSIVNIQIFGTKKCFDTKKAGRYFKERRIKYQFVDLKLKNLSKGELKSVKDSVGLDALVDPQAEYYRRFFAASPDHQVELLLADNTLYKTPIVRNGRQATVGYQPDTWSTWG